MNNYQFFVTPEEDNSRLDVVLSNKGLEKSRSYIQKSIKEGNCKVNGKLITKESYKVTTNDVIDFSLLEDKPLDVVKKNIPINIIYQDEDLLVINKPRGMVVHPANGHYDGDTLVNALLFHVKDLSSINGIVRPGIVHRIDKDTSGLLVVAKNDETHVFLQKQLKDHTMHREYYALCEGIIPHTDLKIDAPLGKDPRDRLKRCVDIYNGKEAVTYVHVIERMKKHTLVSCKLETGRTHQIRVHMQYIKHPLVGDPLYGYRKQEIKANGQILHAYQITFIHPRTKKEMTFTCPVDEEFNRVLEIARNLK
ncbi:MAG: RluA family pseudouridine synthase [Bacillales bacterium]|nr:RluA family pseudouridine synthase [Bacillales bacterium]